MKEDANKAVCLFSEGYNCAQSVLAACGEKHGLDRQTAFKIAQAFGGGIGRTGSVCGAVSGALMCIGLKHPVKDGKDAAGKEKAHALAQKFMAEFAKRNKSLLCRELLGCELLTPEGRRKAHDSGALKERCPKYVKDAAILIDEMLEESGDER